MNFATYKAKLSQEQDGHKSFRPFPLTAETEDTQLMRLEDETESVRLHHALKIAKQCYDRIVLGQMTSVPNDIERYCQVEQVWHTMIPAIVSMVVDLNPMYNPDAIAPSYKCAKHFLKGRI